MTWILLRGLTRETRHWGTFPATLATTLGLNVSPGSSGPDVMTLDLPGNGTEHGVRSPTSVSAMVALVRERAHAAGLRRPYRLLALSLGGMVATAWAHTHPREIDRLVLINTSMRPFGWPHQRMRWHAWPRVLQLLRHWRDDRCCELGIHRLTCADDSRLAEDLRQWIAIRATAPVTRRNAARQLLAAARFTAGTTPPPCPTLVLSSAADRLVSPACSRALARHWNCAYAVHPHAGHDLPHDDPRWVAEQIAAWTLLASTGGHGITALPPVPEPHPR
ncbi:alpha-beta hydrolase superfamily lysophospholipase [Cupriavidus gilardii J11]|uniref:Alpha-beta hydrolase superfamily lysophospholipase n=1 Tax=Cupriavidus gilardii J11 TaxID=936133 RepID=A0A562B918_9BURK|nr:alpha/beta hydrolase [Cupriavidus gilardii]TWG81686.1 alpha-beta hydrolase superfamily lysophospholipase [Cupriavidus gilardii J11]